MKSHGGRRIRAAILASLAFGCAAGVSACTGSTPARAPSASFSNTVEPSAGTSPAGSEAQRSERATPAVAGASPSASPSASSIDATPPTPAQLPAIDPSTLTRFASQTIDWSSCGGGLQCGSLLVPLDYAAPNGPTISLAVIRHRSTASDRIGSVVLNPGGPGGSGVQYLKAAWSAYDQLLQHRFDVVSFDPRGVGESDPVHCVSSSLEDQFVAYDADPASAAQVAELAQLDKEFSSGCEQKSSALLPHIGTVDTARDLDILRQALGDTSLTYIGESYGTFLGEIYAELFPTHIRALVLDGVVDPTLDDVSEGNGQAKGFETALASFIANCVGESGCALGTSASDAESRLDAFVGGLASTPVKGSNGRVLTVALALNGVAAAMYSPGSWSTLNTALRDAMKGNPAGLLALADEISGRQSNGSYTNELEANVAINCADRPAASASIDAAAASALAGRVNGPTFGEFLGWGNSVCIGWPVPAELAPGPVHASGAPPMLVIGTTRDPATPLAWARSVAAQLDSGVLVTWDGDGHTADLRSSCIDDLVTAYVVGLKVPASGTVCPADQ